MKHHDTHKRWAGGELKGHPQVSILKTQFVWLRIANPSLKFDVVVITSVLLPNRDMGPSIGLPSLQC